MGLISEKVIDGVKFLLLSTYSTKPKARYFATQYKDGAPAGVKRLARVLRLGKEWALWVHPGSK